MDDSFHWRKRQGIISKTRPNKNFHETNLLEVEGGKVSREGGGRKRGTMVTGMEGEMNEGNRPPVVFQA